MRIVEFLEARIAEDAAVARLYTTPLVRKGGLIEQGWFAPERVLLECESKQSLITLAYQHASTVDGEWGCCHSAEEIRSGRLDPSYPGDPDVVLPKGCRGPAIAAKYLQPMAAIYSAHPDFDPEWAA